MNSYSTKLFLENGIWRNKETKHISYPEDGNSKCFEIEDNSFWFKHRNRCIVELVKQFPPGQESDALFDIGGGNGVVSKALLDAGFHVVLVEPGEQGVLNAQKRGLPNIVCATTESAGFNASSLPAIGLFDVLEHIKDDVAFLKSISNLLKKEGMLYLTVPSYQLLWSKEDDSASHFRRYTIKRLQNIVAESGFQVIYATYFFRFLPLPIFWARTMPYRFGLSAFIRSEKKKANEHKVSHGFLSGLISKSLSAEINKIKKHEKMYFGGSCLLAAKRI